MEWRHISAAILPVNLALVLLEHCYYGVLSHGVEGYSEEDYCGKQTNRITKTIAHSKRRVSVERQHWNKPSKTINESNLQGQRLVDAKSLFCLDNWKISLYGSCATWLPFPQILLPILQISEERKDSEISLTITIESEGSVCWSVLSRSTSDKMLELSLCGRLVSMVSWVCLQKAVL